MSKNLFACFDDAPTAAIKYLKTQLYINLLELVGKYKAKTGSTFELPGWSEEKVTNFLEGYLEDISIDELVGMIARLGYDVAPTLIDQGDEE